MCVFACLKDAWTCWPQMVTSPSRRLGHSSPVLLSSSPSPVRSSAWSCLTSTSTAALETSSRSVPLTSTHTSKRETGSSGLFFDFKNPEFYFISIEMVTNSVEAAFGGQTPHWSFCALVTLVRASVGRGGFGSEAKPSGSVWASLVKRLDREKTLCGGRTEVFEHLVISCTKSSHRHSAPHLFISSLLLPSNMINSIFIEQHFHWIMVNKICGGCCESCWTGSRRKAFP